MLSCTVLSCAALSRAAFHLPRSHVPFSYGFPGGDGNLTGWRIPEEDIDGERQWRTPSQSLRNCLRQRVSNEGTKVRWLPVAETGHFSKRRAYKHRRRRAPAPASDAADAEPTPAAGVGRRVDADTLSAAFGAEGGGLAGRTPRWRRPPRATPQTPTRHPSTSVHAPRFHAQHSHSPCLQAPPLRSPPQAPLHTPPLQRRPSCNTSTRHPPATTALPPAPTGRRRRLVKRRPQARHVDEGHVTWMRGKAASGSGLRPRRGRRPRGENTGRLLCATRGPGRQGRRSLPGPSPLTRRSGEGRT